MAEPEHALRDTRIHPGGLLRCCIESFHRWAATQAKDARVTEGTRVPCEYCESGVVLDGTTWRWPGAA